MNLEEFKPNIPEENPKTSDWDGSMDDVIRSIEDKIRIFERNRPKLFVEDGELEEIQANHERLKKATILDLRELQNVFEQKLILAKTQYERDLAFVEKMHAEQISRLNDTHNLKMNDAVKEYKDEIEYLHKQLEELSNEKRRVKFQKMKTFFFRQMREAKKKVQQLNIERVQMKSIIAHLKNELNESRVKLKKGQIYKNGQNFQNRPSGQNLQNLQNSQKISNKIRNGQNFNNDPNGQNFPNDLEGQNFQNNSKSQKFQDTRKIFHKFRNGQNFTNDPNGQNFQNVPEGQHFKFDTNCQNLQILQNTQKILHKFRNGLNIKNDPNGQNFQNKLKGQNFQNDLNAQHLRILQNSQRILHKFRNGQNFKIDPNCQNFQNDPNFQNNPNVQSDSKGRNPQNDPKFAFGQNILFGPNGQNLIFGSNSGDGGLNNFTAKQITKVEIQFISETKNPKPQKMDTNDLINRSDEIKKRLDTLNDAGGYTDQIITEIVNEYSRIEMVLKNFKHYNDSFVKNTNFVEN